MSAKALFRPILLGCAVWWCQANIARADEVAIVSPDSPVPMVVSADTQTDRNAAVDLCDYLSRVSGREIQPAASAEGAGVVIHVGRDAFVREHAPEIDDLFADGFIIKGVETEGQFHLILAGKLDRASQWAIEQFLKGYCGVRWLFPDPVYGEVVPSRPAITIDRAVARIVEPDFLGRGTASKNHIYNPTITFVRGGDGIERQFGQHAIQFIFNNGSHSGEIFDQHPEWFAHFDGKRQWWEYGNGWQICTTHPGTLDHAVKYVLDFFEKNPDTLVVSVGPNDGAGWCECPDCTAFVNSFDPPLTISERWFTWVNKVAREVAKTHPDKWVESLAYSQTSLPTRFPLEPNVAITKTFVLDSEFQNARDWRKVCKSVNLYSYMYGNSFMGIRHYPHAARDFLKWGHDELGSRSHVTESGGDWTFDGPKMYYLQALHWDVNADVDAIMDDFCRHSYGAAAEPMRAFWDRFEEIYERRRPVPYGTINRRWLFYQWTSWVLSFYVQPNDEFQEYKPQDVEYLDAQMAEALKLAADDTDAVQFRIHRMDDAWRYYRTALVSYTHFYNLHMPNIIMSQAALDRGLALAKEIADLRRDREQTLALMRAYPHINSRTAGESYWGWFHALTIFNHELTLIDETCFAITRYLVKSAGAKAAESFWTAIKPDDSLFEAAQTQLYSLAQEQAVDLLTNGDFETGDLSGWDSSGTVRVVDVRDRPGAFMALMDGGSSAELSQRVAVSPRERFRLSAWASYPSAPPQIAVPLESIIEFYAGDKRLWDFEPARTVLRTTSPQAGWLPLRSTVTIAHGVTHVVIRLKRTYSGAAQWDQVRFERIKEGVDSSAGRIIDPFEGDRLDDQRWFPISAAPQVQDGWLVCERDDTLIVSYAKFNNLLSHDGDDRYRLRFRAAQMSADPAPANVSFAIQPGTGPIQTKVSGLYWTHSFAQPAQAAQIHCYASQDDQPTISTSYPLTHLPPNAREVWYTLEFDSEFVTIYASPTAYEVADEALVARYPHGIANLVSMGDVYLKLKGLACRLDEITLQSAAEPLSRGTPEEPARPEVDPRELIMPGVTDE